MINILLISYHTIKGHFPFHPNMISYDHIQKRYHMIENSMIYSDHIIKFKSDHPSERYWSKWWSTFGTEKLKRRKMHITFKTQENAYNFLKRRKTHIALKRRKMHITLKRRKMHISLKRRKMHIPKGEVIPIKLLKHRQKINFSFFNSMFYSII